MSENNMNENKTVDCLFIGHNEMNFQDYEKEIQKMGRTSGAFRDLNLNYINYQNTPYTASDIFNLFYQGNASGSSNGDGSNPQRKPISLDETFSGAIAYLGSFLDRRGLTFDYVNTFQAHKLLLKAESTGNQERLKLALFRAFFAEGRDISDPEELLEIAQANGFEGAAAREALDDEALSRQVREKQSQYTRMGISAVPTFVVEGEYTVSGAQTPEVLTQVIRDILDPDTQVRF